MESHGMERKGGREWNGIEWHGMQSNGMEGRSKMEWNGTAWNGMARNGMALVIVIVLVLVVVVAQYFPAHAALPCDDYNEILFLRATRRCHVASGVA